MSDAWRILLGGADDRGESLAAHGARNMAVDQVLFDSAKAGGPPTLRFYRWTPACLSLGLNQPARDRYDVDGRVPGRDIVRRPTGGLAVYHDDELTYSVACRVGTIGSPRETYLRVHRAIAAGLASLGAATTLSDRATSQAPTPRDAGGVCFHAPAEGEILAPAGKLVGSAQRCEARTILQHGSILLAGSQERAWAVPAVAVAAPTRDGREREGGGVTDGSTGGVATLADILGRVPVEAELLSAITAGFTASLGIRLAPASLSAEEFGRLEEAEAKYRSENWTWRT